MAMLPVSRLSRRHALASGLVLPAAYGLGCRTAPEVIAQEGAPSRAREVASLVDAAPTVEGAGVRLRRALGGSALGMLDPFLLLDEIRSDRPEDYAKGFPNHPHRGFETVTYVLDGAMDHRDSLGNHGHLVGGSAQWMTAGHGIIHSEMPQQDRGLIWAFQLWVNLPAAKKLTAPRYQDIPPERITLVDADGAAVRVVAGEVAGRRGPVEGIVTSPTMIDVALAAGARFTEPLVETHTAFAYVIDGSVLIGERRRRVQSGQLAALEPGASFVAESPTGGRFLLCAAQPLREPVARYGPFVMNTDDELKQAMADYRSGRLVSSG